MAIRSLNDRGVALIQLFSGSYQLFNYARELPRSRSEGMSPWLIQVQFAGDIVAIATIRAENTPSVVPTSGIGRTNQP